MSFLLGLELRGAVAHLTVVDRRGEILASATGPLEEPITNWYGVHPEVYYRGIVQLLKDSVSGGLFDPLRIASVGLGVDHGIVLLDPELKVISPREIGWAEHIESTPDLRSAIVSLSESSPGWLRRAGVMFSVLDYLRFRFTGAIASHESFTVAAGLALSPSARSEWDVERLHDLGVRRDALPPIFDAAWRVGVIGPEFGREIGFGRNVWVGGGSDSRSARLLVTAEPVPGSRVIQIDEAGCSVWRAGGEPASFDERAIPLVAEGCWYYPDSIEITDPRGASGGWKAPDSEQWTIDSPLPQKAEEWASPPDGDVWFAWDCGGPTAGVAVQAGIGLGWWRDLRGLWRKRRAPVDYEDWHNSLVDPESPADDADAETK